MQTGEVSDSVAIEADGLRKRFGAVEALCGVTFSAEVGSVLGLLGPNGAGKTTAVRILTTLLAPDGGSARVAGIDVRRQPGQVRAKIGLAGQYAAVDENLTGFENLEMVGRLYHLDRGSARTRATELLDEFGLAESGGRLVRTYSGGMRRRLDLAAALVARPPILFLDEPTTGLDIRSRIALWESIEALVARGTTVLLTTQYLEEADRLADRIAVVNHGVVIADGTPAGLKQQVGGDRLEIRLVRAADAQTAAGALEPLGDGAPSILDGTVSIPISHAGGAVAAAVRRLDEAGIQIDDIATLHPTLDDVFLRLTGQTASEAEEA
jgi:ABC-2 type transport system ATP-binding protein